ncbi:MAG: YncE family protein [Candidatus Methylomirabilis sp.]
MNRLHAVLLTALVAPLITAQGQDTTPLRLVQRIPLPNVRGRIDHLAVDRKGERLFVAALGNNTVEVLDLRTGKRIHTIRGLHQPQGVLFLPEFNKIFVTNGQTGMLEIFNGESFKLENRLTLSDDADNIRYDDATKSLYVGHGGGALGNIDAKSGKRSGDIPLQGHPESFPLERSGPRVFVNVPTANHIAVIDREKRKVVATWALTGARANFPMALDEANRRLFVGVRKPPKLLVFDTGSGKLVASLDSAGDTDDIFYDAALRRIYMSCGEGFLVVYDQDNADHYRMIAKIPTAPGARTSLLVPEQRRLYLAVPRHPGQGAEVRVYEVQP